MRFNQNYSMRSNLLFYSFYWSIIINFFVGLSLQLLFFCSVQINKQFSINVTFIRLKGDPIYLEQIQNIKIIWSWTTRKLIKKDKRRHENCKNSKARWLKLDLTGPTRKLIKNDKRRPENWKNSKAKWFKLDLTRSMMIWDPRKIRSRRTC